MAVEPSDFSKFEIFPPAMTSDHLLFFIQPLHSETRWNWRLFLWTSFYTIINSSTGCWAQKRPTLCHGASYGPNRIVCLNHNPSPGFVMLFTDVCTLLPTHIHIYHISHNSGVMD